MTDTTYHLPNATLPNGMILLNSDAGRKLLNGGPKKVQKNDQMLKLFKPQVNNTYCGPASLALVINGTNTAYRVKISFGDTSVEEIQKKSDSGEDITVNENDIVHWNRLESFFQKINVNKNGMTLEEIAFAAMSLGYGENTYFVVTEDLNLCEDKQKELSKILENGNRNVMKSVTEFRDYIKNFFHKHTAGLICNYDMASLGFVEFKGHFSPIAAYNSEHDVVLVMDVWPKTQPAWVKTELFFDAMSKVDSTSGLPRGFLHMYELM